MKVTASSQEPDPETDQGLVAAGFATLSNLVGVRDTHGPDTTTTAEEASTRRFVAEAVPGAPVELVRRGESEPLTWAG